jgi:hypothetical protein
VQLVNRNIFGQILAFFQVIDQQKALAHRSIMFLQIEDEMLQAGQLVVEGVGRDPGC